MLKGGHRMACPFNNKKLASYLKDEEVIVYETDEYLLLADRFSLFQVGLDEKIAVGYQTAQKYKRYKLVGGQLLEHASNIMDIADFWSRHLAMTDAHIVTPTSYFYQYTESMFLRKFTDGEHTTWILKSLTDLLGPLAINLDYHFQFEQLYDSRNPNNVRPVRVSFRHELSAPLKAVALLAVWNHTETQGVLY